LYVKKRIFGQASCLAKYHKAAFMKQKSIILLCLILSSCSKKKLVEGFIFPDIESKIILNGILTPSDSIFVSLHKLRTVGDKTFNYTNDGIKDATVILENTTTKEKTTLKYLGKNSLYGQSQQVLKIIPNNTYRISASAPTFKSVSASCKVPQTAAVFTKFAYSEPYNDGFFFRRRVEGQWVDVSEIDSLYYGITSSSQSNDGSNYSTTLFSEEITKADKIYFYNTTATENKFSKNYTLLTTEKNLYRYYVMAEKIHRIAISGTGDFFGAFQGIIPEFTNIENGYGVFGAYLSTTATVTFK
jgi:hypothetical protein